MSEWKRNCKACKQGHELVPFPPDLEKKRFKAVLQLVIASNGKIGFAGSDANNRDAQFIPQKTEQIEKLPLHRSGASQQIMEFINDEHANFCHTENLQGQCL